MPTRRLRRPWLRPTLFDGATTATDGMLYHNLDTPGHGAAFRWRDATPYAS
jgi:hypothetical protein